MVNIEHCATGNIKILFFSQSGAQFCKIILLFWQGKFPLTSREFFTPPHAIQFEIELIIDV